MKRLRRDDHAFGCVLAIALVVSISGCTSPKANAGFEERAQAAGIGFRMSFLAREQGERFRINLYDHGPGLAVGDFDNDGRDDIYFLNQHGTNALYRNVGDGSFADVTAAAGLRGRGWAGDVAVFDYDEDGFMDLFVPSMFGRGQLYRNSGHGTFTDVTAETLGRTPHGAIGTKVFDFDGDGRLEIVTNNFNDRPYLFANRFPRRHYIELRLTGSTSNRDAIGAVARLWAGPTVMVRQVNPAGGYLAQSSKVLHFGLGDRTAVDSIQIRWPRGTVQTVKSPRIDTLLQIRESGR